MQILILRPKKTITFFVLVYQLASGEVFGPNQPIALKLLGSQRSIQALEGMSVPIPITFLASLLPISALSDISLVADLIDLN